MKPFPPLILTFILRPINIPGKIRREFVDCFTKKYFWNQQIDAIS